MPIWLRKFTFRKIKEFYDNKEDEAKGWDKAKKEQILRPGIGPSYNTTTSRK